MHDGKRVQFNDGFLFSDGLPIAVLPVNMMEGDILTIVETDQEGEADSLPFYIKQVVRGGVTVYPEPLEN